MKKKYLFLIALAVLNLESLNPQPTEMCYAFSTMMNEKKCSKCGEVKPQTEFVSLASRKSGFTPVCKSCHALKSRQWRNEKGEALKEIYRRRYALKAERYRNDPQYREQEKKRREKTRKRNQEKEKEYQLAYRQKQKALKPPIIKEPLKRTKTKFYVANNGIKTCNQCHRNLPDHCFDFYVGAADGMFSKCRPCQQRNAQSKYYMYMPINA